MDGHQRSLHLTRCLIGDEVVERDTISTKARYVLVEHRVIGRATVHAVGIVKGIATQLLPRLDRARLDSVDLRGARLSQNWRPDDAPEFSRADMRGTDLAGTDLRGSDFAWTKLGDADLSGADLSGIYFVRSSLKGANLKGAELREANLREADLTGANLRGADLEGADLEGAILEDTLE